MDAIPNTVNKCKSEENASEKETNKPRKRRGGVLKSLVTVVVLFVIVFAAITPWKLVTLNANTKKEIIQSKFAPIYQNDIKTVLLNYDDYGEFNIHSGNQRHEIFLLYI